MSIDRNGQGQRLFRCKHRGSGCSLRGRSSGGLPSGARLALGLLDSDKELRLAIRRQLQPSALNDAETQASSEQADRQRLAAGLRDQQQKLLGLYYQDAVTEDLYLSEHRRITNELEQLELEDNQRSAELERADQALAEFETILRTLDGLQLPTLWDAAQDAERRAIVDELLDEVVVHPSWFSVRVHGCQPLTIRYGEVGLKDSDSVGVGGGT